MTKMKKFYLGVAFVSLLASAPAMAQTINQSLAVGAGVVAGRANSASAALGNGIAASATSQQAAGAGAALAGTGVGTANPTFAQAAGAAQQNQFAGSLAAGPAGFAATQTTGIQAGIGVGFAANRR
jgi:hypothetical protein